MPDARFKFRVGPHAIEDLGSNLYTTFPRVLAEFVANAYDADATFVDITCDFAKINDARKLMRRHHLESAAEASDATSLQPLADQFLPETIAIEIRDDGCGMSEGDLDERFLWTAKRRRDMAKLPRAKKRPLMGRKGLGKLAGFGVAHVMEVTTKRESEPHAIRVTLDYDQILGEEALTEIPVPGANVTDEFLPSEHGTVIRLKRLSFDAVKSRQGTVARELSEQFEFVDRGDFAIKLNGENVPLPRRIFAYAWPNPEVPKTKLVTHTLETDRGNVEFGYRIRFRKDRKSLPAEKRGVRVYASNRMAAAPSLFNADTNMHGFRMTDYLDGIVQADFIDLETQDFISTDRRSLRWGTPLLAPLKKFLSLEIKEACKQYQKVRDEAKKAEVKVDEFTKSILDSQPLSVRERKILESLATDLARISKKGVEDEKYQQLLPDIVSSFGQGNLYAKLSDLATTDHPDLKDLLAQVIRLNRLEIDRSISIIKSRLKAIESLDKEVKRQPKDGGSRNEPEVQGLFEESSWLIDPKFADFISADKSLNTTLTSLAKALEINKHVIPPQIAATVRREPDLVFLLGDAHLQTVVIVELKAVNKNAVIADLDQLDDYMRSAREWLHANGKSNVAVYGELICSPPPIGSTIKEERYLRTRMDKLSPGGDVRVRSYIQVLEETKTSHAYLLELANSLQPLQDSDGATAI